MIARELIDDALAGKKPELLKNLERIRDNVRHNAEIRGGEEWSIDHSRPISSFPMTTTLAEINALKNLRPMWHRKNCAKKNKWEGQ